MKHCSDVGALIDLSDVASRTWSQVRFPINPLATCQLGKLTLEPIPGI